MRHSTKAKKPAKPYPDFPLPTSKRSVGEKIILKKEHCFGSWKAGTWQEAYEKYKQDAPNLHAGKEPDPKDDSTTVGEMVNSFPYFAQLKVEPGRFRSRTWTKIQGLRQDAN